MAELVATKRPRGRPARDGDPGREKLVLAARDLLRSNPRIDLHRKELAIAAGVTPALVSYHFQDQSSLIEAVVRPVIDGYLTELQGLLRSDAPILKRLHSLILFLIRLSRHDGQLIEIYINHIKRQRQSALSDFLLGAQRELFKFLTRCKNAKLIPSSSVAFTLTALWGICKTVSHTPELFLGPTLERLDESKAEAMQADMILELMTRGQAIPV